MADERDGLLAFQAALRALEERAVAARKAMGLPSSRREAARAARRLGVGLDDRRIGEWLRPGGGRAPRDPDQVWALVRVWCSWEGRGPGDRKYWNTLLEAARPRRTGPGGIGRPIREWADPMELKVHPAIQGLAEGLPALPAYVRRGHDALLERVASAARDTSAMAVLVGEAATGKTRALWEALSLVPDDWRLWFPTGADRPDAVLKGLPQVGPRTVVWLNDIERYLLTPGEKSGERVAEGLSALLSDRACGPVLILGTIWPEQWATLFGYASPYEDPHAEARALLTGTEISIPATFLRPELDRARTMAGGDPRLAEAVEHAEDGHLTQYLAGGAALRAIHDNASPPAKALINAAIDARRLGHGPVLPRSLLLDAVPGYLTLPQWEMLEDGWEDRAFSYVTDHRPCRGARAPLTPVRAAPGDDDGGGPRVRLADYLEQSGRRMRRTVAVPKRLWDALLAHARGSDLIKLGMQAQERGLYRYALRFYADAFRADPGNTDAMLWSGDLHQIAGRVDDALRCYRLAGENGDQYAWTKAVDLLVVAERLDEVPHWCDLAAENGALLLAADLLEEHGHEMEAVAVLRRAVEVEASGAHARLGQIALEAGRHSDALAHFEAAAEAGDTAALDRVVALASHARGPDEVIAWLSDRQPCGAVHATVAMAELRRATGDLAGAIALVLPLCEQEPALVRITGPWLVEADREREAIDLYRRAAELGTGASARIAAAREIAVREAAELLHGAARTDEALGWLLSRAVKGDLVALDQAGRLALRANRPDEVIAWLRPRAASGDAAAVLQLARVLHSADRTDEAIRACEGFHSDAAFRYRADLLVHTGRTDEAIECYRAAAEQGDAQSLERAAALLRDAGRTDEALDWLRARVAVGDGEAALSWTIDLLLESGRADEAIDWLGTRVLDGDVDALGWLANLLRDAGRTAEALSYYLQLAEAGRATLDSDDLDSGALALAATVLRGNGRHDEALRIVRHGVEPTDRAAR